MRAEITSIYHSAWHEANNTCLWKKQWRRKGREHSAVLIILLEGTGLLISHLLLSMKNRAGPLPSRLARSGYAPVSSCSCFTTPPGRALHHIKVDKPRHRSAFTQREGTHWTQSHRNVTVPTQVPEGKDEGGATAGRSQVRYVLPCFPCCVMKSDRCNMVLGICFWIQRLHMCLGDVNFYHREICQWEVVVELDENNLGGKVKMKSWSERF